MVLDRASLTLIEAKSQLRAEGSDPSNSGTKHLGGVDKFHSATAGGKNRQFKEARKRNIGNIARRADAEMAVFGPARQGLIWTATDWEVRERGDETVDLRIVSSVKKTGPRPGAFSLDQYAQSSSRPRRNSGPRARGRIDLCRLTPSTPNDPYMGRTGHAFLAKVIGFKPEEQ